MSPRTWLAGAALAAVPVVVLVMLVLAGELAVLPAALGGIVVIAAAMTASAVMWRDLALLDLALDAVETRGRVDGPDPRLGPLAALSRRIARIARARTQRAEELAAALRASEAIIEQLPDPLIALDGSGGAGRANAAARAAFGVEVPAVLRHPLLRGAIDRALRERAPQSADLMLPVPVARELHATVIPFGTRLPDGTQTLVVLSDRTRERAVERMREDFVTNASHELRTPLASLMGFVETLRGPAADDPPAQKRFLAIMAEQAARMSRLIDDLLSLSRIELTEHTPPSERIDLATVVGRVVAAFEVRLPERKQALAVEIAPGLPWVLADADQMAQVLTNLVDNGLKYGREGGTVTVSLRPVPEGVVLAVRDDGPGIPRVHLPRLTERFYRVDKGRSRSAGGTGLGLAIVKHIVSRHRGRLLIDSEEGQGASFSVILPAMPEPRRTERP